MSTVFVQQKQTKNCTKIFEVFFLGTYANRKHNNFLGFS